jgi:hypothetical protein
MFLGHGKLEGFSMKMSFGSLAATLVLLVSPAAVVPDDMEFAPIRGLTGDLSNVRIAVPTSLSIKSLAAAQPPEDIDLKRMAQWAMNYLARTPRAQLGFEPVFQCHPLQCPPVPAGQDPVVACDTDARMDWEWYYMRDMTGSEAARQVEAAFHKRIRAYIGTDGKVWSHPGAFNAGNINAQYGKKDRIIHIWGSTKVLKSLSEHHLRYKDAESKDLAAKVMRALKGLATWDGHEGKTRCWFKCGMGGLRPDGTVLPNGWNVQPAPIIEPLVTYWLATGDDAGLAFAKAYAEGMITNAQPGGIRFDPNGKPSGGFGFGPHSHATMHAVWGIAHLGLLTGETRYTDFARGTFAWLLGRGTGTGWFPAGPDNCNETCCLSDMISVATLLGQTGHPEYFDFAERYLRNYISNLQFVVTPEFETYYRRLHAAKGEAAVAAGLAELRKFQGGIIGGSGLNDYENTLLGGASGFEMFGCCAPEGMRAIYTAWANTIDRRQASKFGPAGIYVNLCLSRTSPWGEVVSFMPDAGRLTVKSSVADQFFLRPPHWVPQNQVRAFVGDKPVALAWSGDYVCFDAQVGDELTITYPLVAFTQRVNGLWNNTKPDLHITFQWLGNMVTAVDPAPAKTPLFLGKPRLLPAAPDLK